MEVYVGPSEAQPDVVLSREEVIGALKSQGLVVSGAVESPASGSLRARWILSFKGAEISLQCQETSDGLLRDDRAVLVRHVRPAGPHLPCP
jgi:hypothetical protein